MPPARRASPRVATLALAAAWMALTASLAVSCFVSGFDVTTVATVTTTSEAGSSPDASAGGGGATGGSTGCQHARWPPQPAAPDPGTEDIDFVAAMRTIDFGEGEVGTGVTVGYDLDSRCTCQGEESACLIPDWATADHCDGPEGRDNAAAHLFAYLGFLFAGGLSSEANTADIQDGEWTLLVRVRGYNGELNDDQVELAIYTSPGRDNDPCLPDQEPLWDGTDRWPIDITSLEGTGGTGGATPEGGCSAVGDVIPGYSLDEPRYADSFAYVTNGVVVGNLPQAGITMSGAERTVDIRITAGFVTARIEQDGTGSWVLRDGLLVGRWRLADFFVMVAGAEYDGTPVCPGNAIFEAIRAQVCTYPDVASAVGGPTTPCDALSFAMGFDADPAALGMMWYNGVTPAVCPGQDPSLVTCE